MKTVCVVGLGYVGLPTACAIAASGMQVYGVDINSALVDAINTGQVKFAEADVQDLIRQEVRQGRLRAQMQIPEADAYIIAVPTPVTDRHKPDLSYVEAAFRAIAPRLRVGACVILESTSPMGTSEAMLEVVAQMRPDLKMPRRHEAGDIALVYCPERVLPGNTLHELVHNDRTIGGISQACSQKAGVLYKAFVKGKLLLADAATAELSKLVENAFRDVNVAFANELANICQDSSVDVWELIELANHHPRVNILKPGPGVGGHCIAVDPWFIIDGNERRTPLMQAARAVNDGRPAVVVGQILERIDRINPQHKPTVGCLGLTFKPNVDDIRSSPAIEVARLLQASDRVNVVAVEPFAENAASEILNFKITSIEDCLKEADLLVTLVAHDQFKEITESDLHDIPVLDFVNVLKKPSLSASSRVEEPLQPLARTACS